MNKFVAGFIGSPAMNFINVKLEGGHIVANGLNLKVPEGALKVLKEKGYVGDNEFIAKVDARDYHETGATIELGFDLNKAHFFDKETEKTVY